MLLLNLFDSIFTGGKRVQKALKDSTDYDMSDNDTIALITSVFMVCAAVWAVFAILKQSKRSEHQWNLKIEHKARMRKPPITEEEWEEILNELKSDKRTDTNRS